MTMSFAAVPTKPTTVSPGAWRARALVTIGGGVTFRAGALLLSLLTVSCALFRGLVGQYTDVPLLLGGFFLPATVPLLTVAGRPCRHPVPRPHGG